MVGSFLAIVLNYDIGGCKLAMTSILLLNETITSDSGYWHDIWFHAHSTLNYCVDPPWFLGGYHHVGTKTLRSASSHLQIVEQIKADSAGTLLGTLHRLILTLYAPGSIYDHQISTILNRGGTVCSKEAMLQDTLAGGSDDISGSIGCGSGISLAMPEPALECCNTSTGQNQSIKRGNETSCVSCGVTLELVS